MTGAPRVNGSMLSKHRGNMVCLVGKITEVSPTGSTLTLVTSDKQKVNVTMTEKYEDSDRQCIQIIGSVQQNMSVVAERYTSFSGDKEFDLDVYEKAINLLPRYSQLFQTNAKTESMDVQDWN